ncbi:MULTISPECIES: hypothetical protein [unclassified Curtobacterium]|uniref:hypothetical protein n=1 Tax=unclassified Curtobacterium TaxID=257496 RepID=UPI00140558C5|nr:MULTISPECIES: hypothetical protein [unclassified Curtobacterium]WIE73415.1 hypothetical protein DEJ14_006485 [Curtobacterium sp. MCJR17_020]
MSDRAGVEDESAPDVAPEIRERCHSIQQLDHPAVGQLELQVESFRVAGEEDKSLVT